MRAEATADGPKRIASLDGIRAVAIALVVIAHLAGTRFSPVPLPVGAWLAHVGVRVFFVLSGFLITRLLLDELDATGAISLPRFYFRRALRIFPAFYAYVAFVALLDAFGAIRLEHGDVLAALTYTTNYHRHRAWYLGHAWSLAVEEQFYLLWPAIVALLGRVRAPTAAALACVAAPILRIVTYFAWPEARDGIGETFGTTCDALAAGCLLATLEGSPLLARVRRTMDAKGALAATTIVVLACAALERRPAFDLIVGETTANVGIALALDRCVRAPTALAGRFLNAAPMAKLGTISYSLYLWQQPWLDRHSHASVCAFPANVALAILLAVGSHRLVERPLLRWRSRLERRLFARPSIATRPPDARAA
jgi:peptidoglycan/LPS O-acetylase OafA/YrhL